MSAIELISGGSYTDHRGTLQFLNDFDMSTVKRFYTIEHPDTKIKRGWRGHRIEQRWFYVLVGSFQIETVQIDNWDSPSKHLPIESIILTAESNCVLQLPAGYATCLQALQTNSKVMLFADYEITHAVLDDHLWSVDYFKDKL